MQEEVKNNQESGKSNSKKTQKPGLNAIRPDDYTEQRFKEMAKEMEISQTQLFESMFWQYINGRKEEEKYSALNLEGEINLIANDLNNMLQHFKAISDKCQNTVISLKSNGEQTEANLKLDIETLNNRIEGLTKKNAELEGTVNLYSTEKKSLLQKIGEQEKALSQKELIIRDLRDENSDFLRQVHSLSKVDNLNKELLADLDRSNKEIKNLLAVVEEKSDEIKTLRKKLNKSEEEYSLLKQKMDNEIRVAKDDIRKELSIESKDERLNLKMQYNSLQMENIKNLTTINDLQKELAELKIIQQKSIEEKS